MHFPPQPLTNNEFRKFLGKKQFRGILQVSSGELTCEDGRVANFKKGKLYDHPGYTPIAVRTLFGQPTFFFEKAELGDRDDTVEKSKSCVTRTVTARSRIQNMPGGLTSRVALLNFPPWILRTVKMVQCCDQSVKIQFSGSHFPSHYSYINSKKSRSWTQKGFIEFLRKKGGEDARKVSY
jgi:hypothetical protein